MIQETKIEIDRGAKSDSLSIRSGLGLLALQRKTDLIEYDCKEADCGICLVRVLKGIDNLSPVTKREDDFLKAMRCDPDERLACQARVFGPVHLRVEGDPED
ncbi:MAG: (2Fe-2S)-binding protein [Proteobacteria bacterium]|nr:MAG: (2Fe-2S)-binding protein [Pseudomonadota bacterium]